MATDKEKYYVYEITDKNKPIYVGKSIEPKRRLGRHKNRTGNNNLSMQILECCQNDNDASFWESYYIWLYRSWGFALMNNRSYKSTGPGAENGFFGKNHTNETKKRISKKAKANKKAFYLLEYNRKAQSERMKLWWAERRA